MPDTVHTDAVVDEKLTAAPEDDVAETLRVPVPNASSLSDPKEIDCGRNDETVTADAESVVRPLPN
ncbi:MAG: hypothetical protein ACKOFT_04390 [Actinomycetota bacterium]